ncbi:MAG: aspartate-alanine antiporter [Syntrophorhabdaceae bacterium]|nr:aspartate-alanine antiporter [Syntrophorhabdaceae bacterium]
MEWFVNTLRLYPELAIFLTLGLGYSVGKLKLGKVALGAVTGTLLVGILIGQIGITISPNVKSVFFLMFLFAVGYGVGPQFFRGLKSDGLSQVVFAIILCLACLFSTFLAAKILGFDIGSAAGLLSGACTISAVIGVATDTINQLSIPAAQKASLIDHVPVAYAVTYIFGTAGSAWFLSSIGPKLLKVDLAAECRKMEEKMGAGQPEAGVVSAYQQIVARAYQVTNVKFIHKTIGEFESDFIADPGSLRIFVERIRQGGKIMEPDPSIIIQQGDVLALAARRELLVKLENKNAIGPEVDDRELLDFPAESLDVVITNKAIAGRTLKEIVESDVAGNGRGVFLRKLMRVGHEMPVTLGSKVDRGDVLTLAGAKRDVERAARILGYADRPTDMTDMVFVGIGVLLGGLIGALSIKIGKVPLSLSTSGGALIMGLVFGWLRSVHPTFGRIPAPALWMMNNVGLTTFIAVVGISSGPGFVAGLKEAGLMLFLAGIFVTTMPFVVGIYMGKYVFKMNAGIILGACAGARATTAALGAIQDVAESRIPALGYTVTYAVGNTLLIIWGVVIVIMLA